VKERLHEIETDKHIFRTDWKYPNAIHQNYLSNIKCSYNEVMLDFGEEDKLYRL